MIRGFLRLTVGTVFTLCFLVGCGLFGDGGLPREQIETDLKSESVVTPREDKYGGPANDPLNWKFAEDKKRCFHVIENESTHTNDKSELMLEIASSQDLPKELLTDGRLDGFHPTLAGKMKVSYRKGVGKWVIEKITSVDLIGRLLEGDAWDTFQEESDALCSNKEPAKKEDLKPADITTTSEALYKEFLDKSSTDESLKAKYGDKTVAITGVIQWVDVRDYSSLNDKKKSLYVTVKAVPEENSHLWKTAYCGFEKSNYDELLKLRADKPAKLQGVVNRNLITAGDSPSLQKCRLVDSVQQ